MPLENAIRTGLHQQAFRLAVMLVAVTVVGTLGFMMLEHWSFAESLYMAVITLSTVGFSEVHQLSTAGRIFTTFLIVAGVGIVAYSFGTIGQFLISGELRGTLRRRRMQKKIDQLDGHVIVCGYGRVGQRVTLDLDQQGQDCVVIDTNPERFRGEPEERLAIVSDASDDDELLRCGIEKARGLVAATGNDATNTFITLTARSKNADLVIVARSDQPKTEAKLLKAGANHVISPSTIAGHRIATQLMHPSVVDFLDVVTHAGDEELWLEEVAVRAEADLEGKTLVESNLQRSTGVNVLAVRRRGKQNVETESIADTRLEAGDVLIALGTRVQLDAMKHVSWAR